MSGNGRARARSLYRIALKTEEPFAFAGIRSAIHDAQGVVQPTFALLTTEANPLVAQIHTRMPVILREQDEEDWLNPTLALDAAQALLVPYPAERLMAGPKVSSKVNAATSNSPDLLQPRASELNRPHLVCCMCMWNVTPPAGEASVRWDLNRLRFSPTG